MTWTARHCSLLLALSMGCVADGGSVTASADGTGDGDGDRGEDDGDGTGATSQADGTDGDDGDGDGSDGGTGDDGDTGEDGDETADDGSDTDTPLMCDEFLGSDPGSQVEFTVVNGSAATIYLDWTWGVAPLVLSPPDGNGTWVSFGATCPQIVGPGMDAFCGEGFPFPDAVRIDPGASYTFGWSGTMFDWVPVPVDCIHPDDAANWPCDLQDMCTIPRAPVVGNYGATMTAFPNILPGKQGVLNECDGDACLSVAGEIV